MSQLTMPGLAPLHPSDDPLERVYTPESLAHACVAEIASTLGRNPKRVLEAHVGGGAWLRAVRAQWGGDFELWAGDLDHNAPGLQRGEAGIAYVGRLEHNLDRVEKLEPDWIVGNPPFSEAREQFLALRERLPHTCIAWVLPWDLYSNQTWAATLLEHRPRFVRPICRRVWPCVRGVALWEWWPPDNWHTNLRPIDWTPA